ncbi:MAG TPA: transposase [Gemmataceae bacterium]|nr:transposase [Gemmataceae bacterium]
MAAGCQVTRVGRWLPCATKRDLALSMTNLEYRSRGLEAASRERLKGDPIYLIQEQAEVLFQQFRETANHRQWEFRGVAIMANHIHLVVGVLGDPDPEILIGNFKSYGSRALNRRWGKPASETWRTGHGGSTRKLPNEAAILAALEYLRNLANPLLIWIADVEASRGRKPPGG